MPAQSAQHFGLVVYALRKLQQGQNAWMVPPWMAAGVQVWGCAERNPMLKIRMDADFQPRQR
jgi:hypothetical protein